ncbi:MAG: ABC transporter permease [Veillonella sp.]|uniref:ABC transporter permease n=1 Tax=Veillonella sp. TaxID=1926307 RepID=UPI002600E217|nr:ABC transporter permease [Veillonella sp.]MBE6080491.1 ABC transporter permease [Veillonella sp.]
MIDDKARTETNEANDTSKIVSVNRQNSSWRAYIKYVEPLLYIIGVLWVVATLTFGLMQLTNDDVVDQVFSQQQSLSVEAQAEKRTALGLTAPIWVQYGRWLGGVIQGDLGQSLVTGEPVSALLWSKLPASLLLMGSAVGLTLLIALPLGLWTAHNAGTVGDRLVRGITLFGNTMPNFFTALLLLYVVALKLNWLPVIARHNDPTALILPTVTLVWSMSAKYIQQIRALALDELSKPYIRGLRTRGLSWYVIYSRYILRAIAGPIVALVALSCGSLLGGVTIVETIFMWDGVGKMAFDAITARDYPVLQAYVLWLAALYILFNGGADFLQRKLNHREREEAGHE